MGRLVNGHRLRRLDACKTHSGPFGVAQVDIQLPQVATTLVTSSDWIDAVDGTSLESSLCAVPMVLDGVVSTTRDLLRDFRPLIAKLVVQRNQELFLFLCPWGLINARV